MAETDEETLKENPPLPFFEYKNYQGFCSGQMMFASNLLFLLLETFAKPTLELLGDLDESLKVLSQRVDENIQLFEEEVKKC